jgi:hypothetical protein
MRFVFVEVLARAMAQYAPPAWCKLAIQGALHTHRVDLYAATGSIRAYLPRYHLTDEEGRIGGLPPRLRRRGTDQDELLERYHLKDVERPNREPVEIWDESWTSDPWRIAPGWFMFSEEWDWDSPSVRFEFFEIPEDYLELFGYDDIHAEGDPDLALYYDATFTGLCLEFPHAESIAPMVDLDTLAFGSKNVAPVRKIGRPKRSGFESADEPLVRKMIADAKREGRSAREFIDNYVDSAAGHGTRESKKKRLERRLRDFGH